MNEFLRNKEKKKAFARGVMDGSQCSLLLSKVPSDLLEDEELLACYHIGWESIDGNKAFIEKLNKDIQDRLAIWNKPKCANYGTGE